MTVLARLEACIAQHWWTPPGVTVVDRPELCYLRSTVIPPLNLVLRLRAPRGHLERLVDEVHQAHRHAGSICWVYPHHEGAALEALLAKRGYAPGPGGDARVLALCDAGPLAIGGVTVRPIASLDDCYAATAVSNAAFGQARTYSDDDYRQILTLAQRAGAHRVQFLGREDQTGRAVCFGSLSVHPGEDFAVLLGGSTVPDFQGRGAYRALLAARIEYARSCGVRWVGVFADPKTSSPIVSRLGFERYGGRVRWVRPTPAPPA